MRLLDVIYTDTYAAVILYRGEKYAVSFELEHDKNGIPVSCRISFVAAPDAELTQNKSNARRFCRYGVKWGGWPQFIQDEVWPASDAGIPFDYLCTVDTQWGDAGNANIFILTDKTDAGYEVVESWIEASCH